ncbi:MAG TPA: RHS repeat-associated core domain-containing protein [Rhizomicrobium sp.]|nr:RHS repeat-associated core domain-containing protein [Rhizomicrobium sp.]
MRIDANGTANWKYVVGDHLGSPTSINGCSMPGCVVEHDSYDAWGKRRNPDASDDSGCTLTSVLTRGFTQHEMLDSFCLVNMNARVYDPGLGLFISADSMVPNPYDFTGFQRYSYVGNNPLNAIDPSGHDWISDAKHYLTDDPSADNLGDLQSMNMDQFTFDGVDSDPTETVVVLGRRDPCSRGCGDFAGYGLNNGTGRGFSGGGGGGGAGGGASQGSSKHQNSQSDCNQTLVDIGNWFENVSALTGNYTIQGEGLGLAVAGGGWVTGQEYLVAPGLALAGGSGFIGLYVGGGAQIIGGLFQGAGGAGYSNAIYGTAVFGLGYSIGKAGDFAAGSPQSASERATSAFINQSNTVAGATYDAVTSAISQLGPQQKMCTRSH